MCFAAISQRNDSKESCLAKVTQKLENTKGSNLCTFDQRPYFVLPGIQADKHCRPRSQQEKQTQGGQGKEPKGWRANQTLMLSTQSTTGASCQRLHEMFVRVYLTSTTSLVWNKMRELQCHFIVQKWYQHANLLYVSLWQDLYEGDITCRISGFRFRGGRLKHV